MNRKSGKRSASSSGSPPEPAPLFIDRCAWSAALGGALAQAGIPFVAHREHVTHDTPDEEWLAAAADKGWLVVTRDQRMLYGIGFTWTPAMLASPSEDPCCDSSAVPLRTRCTATTRQRFGPNTLASTECLASRQVPVRSPLASSAS